MELNFRDENFILLISMALAFEMKSNLRENYVGVFNKIKLTILIIYKKDLVRLSKNLKCK